MSHQDVFGVEKQERELELLALSMEMQSWTTQLLAWHRRRVAANKLLPSANGAQRDIALRSKSDVELLASAKVAAKSTVQRYRTRAASTFDEAIAGGLDVWALVEQRSGTVDSWYTFKAGVQYFLEEETVRAKRALDKWQRERRVGGPSPDSDEEGALLVKRLVAVASSLHATPCVAPQRFAGDGRSKRYAKHSKSASIRTAPDNWREEVAQAMKGRVKLLFLIQCVTGCRPQELANGAQVRLLRDGTMVTRVHGAKMNETAGQPIRSMRVSATSGFARELASLLRVGVTVNSRACGLGEVNTYGTSVSRACARALPERRGSRKLSAYSARHQFKADLVAAGWTKAEIAMAMGHSTTRSSTAYGSGGRRSSGGVVPIAIKARRPVRQRAAYPAIKHSAAAPKQPSRNKVRTRPKP